MKWPALAAVGAAVALSLAGCGGSSNDAASTASLQKQADMLAIDQIERTWHRAASTHDVDLMMSLWAPGAVFNIDQKTLAGKPAIRRWFLTENKAFRPNHHWESDSPTYKIRIDLNGDKATMYFECHYIDAKTSTVVGQAGVTHTLQKIDGKWLIINSSGSTATLGP